MQILLEIYISNNHECRHEKPRYILEVIRMRSPDSDQDFVSQPNLPWRRSALSQCFCFLNLF